MSAEIPLHGRNGVSAVAIVDEADVPLVSGHRWFMDNLGYARTNRPRRERGSQIRMHRLIMDAKPGQEIDHINRNPRDNRRCNLRVCDHRQNSMNRGLQSNNRSGHTGVYYDHRRARQVKAWLAFVYLNGKRKHIGRFATKDEAIAARAAHAVVAYGDFNPALVRTPSDTAGPG